MIVRDGEGHDVLQGHLAVAVCLDQGGLTFASLRRFCTTVSVTPKRAATSAGWHAARRSAP